MQDLIDDLLRRAVAYEHLADECATHSDDEGRARCLGKAEAYKHAADLACDCLHESVCARFERDR